MLTSRIARRPLHAVSRRTLAVALAGAALLVSSPAAAQLTTATIRGQVTANAAPAPGATVTARSPETGFTTTAQAGPDGSYVLTGLRPGVYDISFAAADGASITRRVTVQVGQTATLDVDTAEAGDATDVAVNEGETIVVTGTQLVETRTSEIGTNVTRRQIEDLPQNNRNFINFAQLAPGVQVLQTEFRQTFGGGGVGTNRDGDSFGGPQVNVFIDGVSLRSNVNQGGIVGQDVSRGNPFSQLAVAEFRVLTSNFKAEFEDAGTSIITAITRSGTNRFSGQAFGSYQDASLIDDDFFIRQRQASDPTVREPELTRYQFGASLGGPIARDQLFFFVSYEGNYQDRANIVVPGTPPTTGAQLPFNVNDFAGGFASPFREDLGFAKLTWQVSPEHIVEASGSLRIETDVRDFGGQASIERGSNVDNNVYTGRLRWDWTGNGFLNEASIDYLQSDLSFGADFSAGFGRNFQGIIQVGGRADFQEVQQEGLTFRNNLSLTDINFLGGAHLIKLGVRVSRQNYRVGGSGPNANPQFEFFRDASQNLDFDIPALVRFGGGDPNIEADTTQVGLFIQDDWEVNENLTLNLGLRWDYDSNYNNRDFVTSPQAAAALRALGADPRIQPAFFDVENYISDGDREQDFDNFAPRVGFSYDINADQRTVIFGGYGRYYDRALFRSAAEESLLRQFRSGELLFSRDGLPRQGRPTIRFQPQFLTPDGFAALLASLAADPTSPGTSELRAIPNDLATPYTDQFSVGIRQRFGPVQTSLSYSYIIGEDQIGYAPLNRSVATNADGFLEFIPLINGFSNVVAAFNTRATRYHGIYLTIDKPYTRESGWGFGVNYTYSDSTERGFSFNFDFPNIGARPFVPNSGDEEHRVVINGIVDLPHGFRFSTLARISSGVPFFVIDASRGFGPRDILFPGNVGDSGGFFQVDLRLQKAFRIFGGSEITLSAELFNLTNENNFGSFDGFIPRLPEINSNFGRPNGLAGPPRSFQFGASFRF